MSIISIILLVILIILLALAAFMAVQMNSMNVKLRKLKNTNQKVNTLSILQDFLSTISSNISDSKEKFNEINNTLIEKYEIKYSTIVIFDGIDYQVMASNVGEKHWKTFKHLNDQEIFSESINNATPKYITVSNNDKLPYLEMEFDRAKSAIFFPLYVDNIYIGYWLIEGSKSHEFDNIDTTILEVVKKNIVSVTKSLKYQRIIENMVVKDEVSGLNSEEFLYANGMKTIDKYPTSIVSLIKIINYRQIEDRISKKTADNTMAHVVDVLKSNLSPEYITVRYSEDKIAIVFSGSDMDGVGNFLESVKTDIEKLRIKTLGSVNDKLNGMVVAPKLNIAMKMYYKESALEQLLISLNQYLDDVDVTESDITCL